MADPAANLSNSPDEVDLGRPVIGLAGGIGAGKSTVAQILAELGCAVSDSDQEVRTILREPEVIHALQGRFGERVMSVTGLSLKFPESSDGETINRSALADIVFTDSSARKWLEELIHPRVHELRRCNWRKALSADQQAVRAFVIDAPLLFEAGLDGDCDAVIWVEADRLERLSRVRLNRGWDEMELDRREKSQLPLESKRERSDYVVTNSGDLEALRDRVRMVLDEILHAWQGKQFTH